MLVLGIAVTLVVPAILAVNGIRLVANERYVEAVYDYGGVPDDRTASARRRESGWRWSVSSRSSRRRKASRCCAMHGSRTARRRSTFES